jgi:hypothetical protein
LLQYVVECNSSARDRYEAAEIHRTDQRRSSLAVAARAQQTDRKRRIGVLLLSNAEAVSLRREIREGLPKGGYAEWQNIDFEVQPAEGKLDLLPSLATELVAIKVDVIVAIFTPCALAAKQATDSLSTRYIFGRQHQSHAGGVTSLPTTPGGSTAKPPILCAIPAAAHPK